MFVRSWKEGSQVAPLTEHLSIRRRGCTMCCRSHEGVVEETERVPAAAARVARPERQRWAWCATTSFHPYRHSSRPSQGLPHSPTKRDSTVWPFSAC